MPRTRPSWNSSCPPEGWGWGFHFIYRLSQARALALTPSVAWIAEVTTNQGAFATAGTVLVISAASRARGAAVLTPTAPVRNARLRGLAELKIQNPSFGLSDPTRIKSMITEHQWIGSGAALRGRK